MKFSEIEYVRPNMEEIYAKHNALNEAFLNATSGEEQLAIYREIDELYVGYVSMAAFSKIRNSINSNDEFYKAERRWFAREGTKVSAIFNVFNKMLFKSPYREFLEKEVGYVEFRNMALEEKAFSTENIEDRNEENSLVLEYSALLASLVTEFDGKEMALPLLAPYKESLDFDVRKSAFFAEGESYSAVKDKFDDIYDKLVKVRTRQAKKLGMENFIELGYARMMRNCYTNEDIALFRKLVLQEIVPLANEIQENRRKRIGASEILFQDLALSFKNGSPKPRISAEEIVAEGKKMYSEMSSVTKTFIELMMDNELFDLDSKEGKSPGGFCSFIKDRSYPFIFANFNETAHDVKVFTHEAGHAFARYIAQSKSKGEERSNYSLDIAETHAMSMEFLTMPWHHLFFKEDTEKYSLSQMEDAILFIPYACQVDEFQEEIYKNPSLTPSQRDDLWLEIEGKYRPYINYKDIPFYKDGAGWQRQQHIYKSPFYYIDYSLAQIMALQFFKMNMEDSELAFKTYMDFVEIGGTMTFVDIAKACGLESPFSENSMREIALLVKNWIYDI